MDVVNPLASEYINTYLQINTSIRTYIDIRFNNYATLIQDN